MSGTDYFTSWIAVAVKVDSAQECSDSSRLVPRLDRWLASELIKGLKGVLESQFKVQGYIESCARQKKAGSAFGLSLNFPASFVLTKPN
jgi:hypothetical protein